MEFQILASTPDPITMTRCPSKNQLRPKPRANHRGPSTRSSNSAKEVRVSRITFLLIKLMNLIRIFKLKTKIIKSRSTWIQRIAKKAKIRRRTAPLLRKELADLEGIGKWVMTKIKVSSSRWTWTNTRSMEAPVIKICWDRNQSSTLSPAETKTKSTARKKYPKVRSQQILEPRGKQEDNWKLRKS